MRRRHVARMGEWILVGLSALPSHISETAVSVFRVRIFTVFYFARHTAERLPTSVPHDLCMLMPGGCRAPKMAAASTAGRRSTSRPGRGTPSASRSSSSAPHQLPPLLGQQQRGTPPSSFRGSTLQRGRTRITRSSLRQSPPLTNSQDSLLLSNLRASSLRVGMAP